MLIDTHLHLSEEPYEEIDNIINQAKLNNVNTYILGGTSVIDNDLNIEISKHYQGMYLTLGYHPSEANDISLKDINLLKTQLKQNSKVVAIGEIGLDYHYDNIDKEKQKELFKMQLQIAQDYDLPVVIHMRDATSEVLEILKAYQVKGVFHCFSGSLETAKEIIKMGFYLGIGGVVTFSNSNLKKIVKELSLDHIVLETDSPYLSPSRGKKNNPANIKIIAQYLADLKEISLEEVTAITTRNATSLFDLKNHL